MKSKFSIRKHPFGSGSLSLTEVVTEEIKAELSEKIAGESVEYVTEEIDERNVGNYIIFEHNGIKNYIILLNYRSPYKSEGRNSFTQSIPTAYSAYIKDPFINKEIYFYDVFFDGSKYEPSIEMALKISVSMGIQSLNDNNIKSYKTLDELISFRNNNKKRSRQNNPSYIEKTDSGINIYGKVFGANSKDTELMCHAINNLYSGKITLYQIMDNDQKKLSKSFINYLESTGKFIIKDDLYSFRDLVKVEGESPEEINLRNPKFINNLFEKYGDKKCALCSCDIHQIIDGAHVFPIEAIKELDLSDDKKLELAIDADNGMWLCKNHHKLFDSHLIHFINDDYKIDDSLKDSHKGFINDSIDGNFKDIISTLNVDWLIDRYEFYNLNF